MSLEEINELFDTAPTIQHMGQTTSARRRSLEEEGYHITHICADAEVWQKRGADITSCIKCEKLCVRPS